MSKQFGIPLRYNNKLELAKRFLDIYLAIKPPKTNWVGRATEGLAYFLAFGYSNKTLERLTSCFKDGEITKNYATVLVSKMKSNGYLVIDPTTHKKRLSDELINCQKMLFEKEVRTFTIGFIKNE